MLSFSPHRGSLGRCSQMLQTGGLVSAAELLRVTVGPSESSRGLAGAGVLSREMASRFWHSDSPSGCSTVGQPLTAGCRCSSPCELSGLGRGPVWTRSWLAAAGGVGKDAGPGRSKLLGIPHQQPNPHLHFQCLVSAAAAARVMIAKAQSFPDLLSGSRRGARLGRAGSSSAR